MANILCVSLGILLIETALRVRVRRRAGDRPTDIDFLKMR